MRKFIALLAGLALAGCRDRALPSKTGSGGMTDRGIVIFLGVELAAAFFLTACSAGAQDSAPDVSGVWTNERGSAVTFVENDGLLSGYYNTQLGNPDPASRFPLTGFIEGDQLTFTVNFKGYGSLTSWTGQMSEDAEGPYIRTLWHLTRDVPDAEEDADMWSSIIAGSANFRPVSANAAE